MPAKIDVLCLDNELEASAGACRQRLIEQQQYQRGAAFQLVFEASAVKLRAPDAKQGDIYVDLIIGASAHRRKHGGGYGQAVVKACGLSGRFKPYIFDATPGLAGDAFVLASLGSHVDMMERAAVSYTLIDDALRRARLASDPELELIIQRMNLFEGDSIEHLGSASQRYDVIYLDPMFPNKTKQAKAKKEMQAFQALIGKDSDESALLEAALSAAIYRVAVKRPKNAAPIEGPQPSAALLGRSSRFDIYGIKKLPS